MSPLARLAVGTVQPEVDTTAVSWALLDLLDAAGFRVQSFLSRACFVPREGATTITGQSPRHLDSWLMTPDLCREVFLRGMRQADFAVVEGKFGDSVAGSSVEGGNLGALCSILELPRLAVVDVSQVSDCDFSRAAGGDRRRDFRSYCRPCFAVPLADPVRIDVGRAGIRRTDGIAGTTRGGDALRSDPGAKRELCKALGKQLALHTDPAPAAAAGDAL